MVVYLVKAYYIPLTFVINNDQTRVHLEPNDGERTWEPKKQNMCKCCIWRI